MKTSTTIRTPLQAFIATTSQGEVAGAAMLREAIPASAAHFHAWRVYRLVLSWIRAEAQHRPTLFDRAAIHAATREIPTSAWATTDSPNAGLVLLLCEMLEERPDHLAMARAAFTVVDWALGRNAVETALGFARAAAALAGTSQFAWLAGRLHREHGRMNEAETWFRLTYLISTRERDPDSTSRALMSWGRVDLDVGRYRDARDQFGRALALAARHRLRDRSAEAHHDLFLVAMALEDHSGAARESAATVAAYGAGHPRLPYFAHDLAAYWTERGDYVKALDALLPLLETRFKAEPANRLMASATAMRAAGGAGQPGTFDLLWSSFDELRSRVADSPYVAQGLLRAAQGASALRRWDQARTLLVDASHEAMRSKQQDIVRLCDRLLDGLGTEQRKRPVEE